MKINLSKVLELISKHIKLIIERIKKEPVLVRSFLTILIGLGLVEISDKNLNTIDQVVLAVVILAGGFSARRQVKPLPPSQRPKSVIRRKRKKN